MTTNETKETVEPESHQTAVPPAQVPDRVATFGWKTWVFLLIIAGVGGMFIHSGIAARVSAETALETETQESSIPTVSVVQPSRGAASEEIVLPGNTQAFTDTPIYARTNGYLRKWYVDIGAKVKTGDLLAEIETPEIDHQLQQARADLATAMANLHLAESTAERYQVLLRKESVSKQETDEKVGDLNAKKAIVDSAQSNVHRLQDLQSYQRIYAPFDGIITARNIDVGALVDAGAGTPGKELFHLAATNRLRVYVSVPEVNAAASRPGAEARLTLDEFPGRVFTGTIARNSNAIDSASHTLLTEVDVANPTGELLPGAYVKVHLHLAPATSNALTVPVNTLLFRSEGLRIAVVRDGKADLLPVKLGRDYGNEVEVIAGLRPGASVILNPSDSLVSGTPVKVAQTAAGEEQGQ